MRSAIALHTVSTWHPRCLHAVNGVQVEKLFAYLERSPQAYSRPETVALSDRLQPAYQKVLEEIRVGHHCPVQRAVARTTAVERISP
jgi:hypothetical protein